MKYCAIQKYLLENKIPCEGPEFEQARLSLYRQGIKVSYEALKDGIKRVIFGTARKSFAQNSEFFNEANGLIMNAVDWSVLCYPSDNLCYNIDTEKCNVWLQQGLYYIDYAEDGTTFNMYFCRDQWVISTSKGYEMNNVKWRNKTYQQIVEELLEKSGTSWVEFCAKLNKKYSYTFGFKHPDFHPFWESRKTPIYRLWFIQYTILDVTDEKYMWISPINGPCAGQREFTGKVYNLQFLYRLAKYAFENYKRNGAILYGFILRSTCPIKTGAYSSLYVESSLMQKIRKSWYDSRILTNSSGLDREKYIVLSSFLNQKLKDRFFYMFAQYKEESQSIENKVAHLAEDITENTYRDMKSGMCETANIIYRLMSHTLPKNIERNKYKDIVKNYIMYSDLANVLYSYVYPSEEKQDVLREEKNATV
jgi:hypothetical protein